MISRLNLLTRTFTLVLFFLFTFSFTHAQVTGKSLSFDGVNDYIQLGGDNDFGAVTNFQGDFTFEAWVLNDGSNNWARVFDFGDSQNDYIIFTVKSADTGQCRFEYRTGGGVKYKIDGGIFPTGWTHVACRLGSNGEASILFNGVEVANASGWPWINNIFGTTKNYLGKSQFNDPYFKGLMKEVRVWKEYRTDELINEWMNCEISGSESNLIGYFKLNEGIVGANNNAHDFHCMNLGLLSISDGVLRNFALVGSSSNWVDDSPTSFSENPLEQNTIEFSNRNDAFILNNEGNFDFDSEYTVEYWLFPNFNWPTFQLPLIKGTPGANMSFYSDHKDGQVFFGQRTSSGSQTWATATGLAYNKWTHITLTGKEENGGVTNKIYFDGVLKATNFHAGIQIPQNNESVKLGSSGWFKMANIRFWNRALNSIEIAKNISSIYPSGTPNLISQYVQYDDYTAGLVDNIGNNDGVRNATPIFSGDPCFVHFTQEPQDAMLPNLNTPIDLSADIIYCNDANYTYQWKFEGNTIAGATSLTYSIPNPTAENLGKYTLDVLACGKVFTSREATITVENQGKVLHFDGIDDKVTFADLIGTSPYTIEARVRFDTPPSNQNIIAKTNTPEDIMFAQLAVSSDGYFQHNAYQEGGNNEILSAKHPTKIIANKWYNIAAHYDGSNHWIIVDGVMGESVPRTGNTGSAVNWNTGGNFLTYNNFGGEMDELRIWNINNSTINTLPTIDAASANLIHYFQFNEGIANADNSSPAINIMQDPFTMEVATLANFSLTDSYSNWLGCDTYDTPISISNDANKFAIKGSTINLQPFINGADGSETFQWHKNGVAIPGANQLNLEISNLSYADEGQYVVEVGRFNTCNTFSGEMSVLVKGTGEVLNFDGENDHIFIPSSTYSTGYTVECWIKFEDGVAEQSIICGSNDYGPTISYSHQLYTDENGYLIHRTFNQAGTGASAVPVIQSLNPVNPNQWYHVAIRANTSGVQLLVDGVLQSSQSFSNGEYWTGQTNWYIGSNALADKINGDNFLANYFKGEMDELRIWDKWISDAIINAEKDHEIQNSGLTGLTHYFKFNRGLANEANQNLNLEILPNYKNLILPIPVPVEAHLLNFGLSSDTSNFSDCSPITNPELAYYATNSSFYIGQTVDIDLDISAGDTSILDFQWLLDDVPLPDQTSPLLDLGQLEEDEFGIYTVIVSDQCNPQFIDTLPLTFFPATNNCFIQYANPTNYPDSTQYIFCGDFEASSTVCQNGGVNGVNSINFGYCDSDKDYLGLDVVFHIPLTSPKVVDLTLSNIQVDADMWLFGDDCDLSNCLATSITDFSDTEFIRTALPAGDYYLMIDQLFVEPDAEIVNDSLVLDIQMYDDKCVFSDPIDCGETVTGSSTNSNFIAQYDQLEGYTGREQVYELVIAEPKTITATLSELAEDLDIFLLDSMCNETNLLISSTQNGSSEETFSYGVQPGTYYLVVDGKNGVEGNFTLEITCANYFDASVDESDAFINLKWSIDKKACVPQDTGVIVRLITTPNTILYEQEYFTAALTPDVITGEFSHLVGDDVERMYVLRVSNRLSNETLCNEIKTGGTLPFQLPEILAISQAEAPDTIKLTWRNHSDLSDEFRIYRDGSQIVSLSEGYAEDSLLIMYVDRHNLNNANSITEATIYNYCIETYNNTLDQSYSQVCGNGSTADINFFASDGGSVDKVELTWNDISAFSDGIIISRNGIQQEILSPNETFYNDMSPIHGVVSEYKLTLLRGGVEKIMVIDNGFVEANGLVRGQVISEEGGYPVQNAMVTLKKDSVVNNETVLVEVGNINTDFEGKFEFSAVVYGLSNDFQVSVQKDGSDFTPEAISFELNSALPTKTDLLFTDLSDVSVSEVTILDTLHAEVQGPEDLVVIHWDYNFMNTETAHFILKRNGELIYEGNDAGGKISSFTDLTGVPGFTYTYALDVFRYNGNSIEHEILSINAQYPALTPISGFIYTLDGEEQIATGEMVHPKITLDWSANNHPSQNFNGFRIFRNNILIGEVASFENNSYTFITEPNLEAGYEIRTYKKINGTTYESVPYPVSSDSLITALPLWQPAVFDDPFAFPPTSDRAILLDIDPLSTPVEFFQDGIFTGVLLERKIQNSDDSTYVFIDDLTKQFIAAQADAQQYPQIWDAFGIPGENYTYRLSTYLDLDGERYLRSITFDRTCPNIIGPSNLQKSEEIGKVDLSWTDNSIQEGLLSQLYINYSGYELTRRDITNGGVEELLATLPANEQSYTDFVSNPIYNLFFDAYENASFEYKLKAYFDIEGQRYFSDAIFVIGGPLDGSVEEPLPINFIASDNIPGHIKLCWEWTATKPSQFIIYRDTLPLDTLPTTARAYYDYNAPEDPSVLYRLSSLFNGVESQKVLAEGRMPSNMKFYGRVTNDNSGNGIPGVTVRYRNLSNSGLGIEADEFSGVALTDAVGNYYFGNLPYTPNYQYQIKIFSNNVDFTESESTYQSFDSEIFTIGSDREYNFDFMEYSLPDSSDVVSPIAAVTAMADADSMYVNIAWSPVHANYDGFQIFRVNQLIGEVKKGEGFNFKDKNGFPGIGYIYTVRAYKSNVDGRTFSEYMAAAATFPNILPVENLTVTAFTEKNQMLVSWSHPLDSHDSYRLRRNGEFVANIPTGGALMWYDDTGVPGLEYQYEVTAIKGANISDPVVVTKNFKGVGEVKELRVEVNEFEQACSGVLTNDNHVSVFWEYMPEAADGFEVYRDGILIAEIDSAELSFGDLPLVPGEVLFENGVGQYDDHAGIPGTIHTYHILPFVIREGARYTSGIEELFLEESILFPDLAEVKNLDVSQNNILGSADISFTYLPYQVDGFHILRDGVAIDTLLEFNEGSYVYQDFTGLPGEQYTYAVRAFDKRENVVYLGGVACIEDLIYPIVPVPQAFQASQGTFENHIEVSWEFSTEAFVDSFYLENLSLNTQHVFASGKRKFVEVINEFDLNTYEYRIRASRINQGQTLFSDWTEVVEGWSSRQITGSENTNVENDILSTNNGQCLAIDGEWAVSGAVNGQEKIFIYRRINGGWSLFQSICSPYPGNDVDFGYSVAISGNSIVVGAPKDVNGSIIIYEFDGLSWGSPLFISSPGPGNFGWAVDIDQDDIIVGNPLWNNSAGGPNHGAIYWYKRESDNLWYGNGAVTAEGGPDIHFGMSVAIENGYSIAKLTQPSQILPLAYVKNANGNWVYQGPLNSLAMTHYCCLQRDNIDIADGVAVFGDWSYSNNAGRVRVAELENNVVVNSSIIVGNYGNDANFGSYVGVAKIPSPIDEAIYVAIGATRADINGYTDAGASALYSNASGSFQLIDEIFNDNIADYDFNGYSVAVSKDAWGAGIYNDNVIDNGSIILRNLLSAPIEVEATEDISLDFDPTETTISWQFDGNYDLLAGFNIYRGEEFLTYRDKATMTLIGTDLYEGSWNDNSGEAGFPYVYSVTSVNNIIPFESYGTSDEGNNIADGKIIGAVKTQLGLVPVPGVKITATGIVDGEVFTYSTLTQPNGEYILANVFYDPDESILTQYEVTGEFLDHVIIPQTQNIAYLNPLNDPTQGVVDFFDVTAYVIKGSVAQPNIQCPIEGLKISQIINGVPDAISETFTDADGNYSLVINPFQEDLQEIRVRIDQSFTEDGITTEYNFIPDADTIFTDFNDFPLITEINFNDALTYDVELKVKNTCNDAISNGKWTVRVRTLDGCFDEEYVTNTAGELTIPLIPANYTMSVVGVDIPTAINQQALDYYSNFPVSLGLLDYHQDLIDSLSHVEIEALASRQFTFHKAAQIDVIGFNDIICETETAILQQGVEYTLSFDVFEEHNGMNCSVQEGIIVITNPAAQNGDPVTIPYNENSDSFDDYTFVTGNPNQIFPHAYAVTFDYKSEDGIFLGRVTKPVFVEGSVSLPGTDVLVDPASGNDAVPYPLLVLRDPPGDQSSSYIAAEQTISFDTEMSMESEIGASLYTEIETQIFETGTEISTNLSGGYTSEKTIEISNSVTTATTISTSDDEDNIGRGADIIVGTGLVMQFGYILEFRVAEDECSKIEKVTKYGISPNAATTTWSYQVGQIEEIIQGYRNDSIRVEEGTLIVERFGKPLSTEDALVFLNSNINNWNQVLRYHDVETVPYYYLCTLNPNAAGSSEHATQIGYWQAQIRPFFGSMVDGKFVLNEDITWDDQLINIYNAASAAIRNLLQGQDLSIWSFPYVGDQSQVDLNVPLGDFNLVDLVSILTAPGLTDYTNNFGDQVKNITTGGNVLIEESINNAQASTTSMSNTIFLGTELDLALVFGGSSEIVVGTFLGLGGGATFATVQELFETEVKVGTTMEATFSRSNSYASTLEESVEVGYTIFDDDNVDALSFAVVQAVTPNSTPYFDYFGGHSSCPPEDGSVYVDNPKIAILDLESGGTSQTKSLFNVPAEEAATFYVIVENQSPIASQPDRELEVYLESGSNDNGAVITINGVSLNNSTYIDSFSVGEPDTLILTVERGPTSYDYPDLQIGFEPTCGEGPRQYIYASAYFVNPCSPVTLVSPIENWVINDDTTKLVVTMQDYDPENPFLVDATLQYRRLGTGMDWTDVPGLELESGNFIPADTLAANDAEYAEGQIPKYFFIWTIPTTEGEYPDGNYEVRAKMQCNNFSSTISNVIGGSIARDGLNLFGNPEPSDQIWTAGDVISFTFNKDLDCALLTETFIENNVTVYNENTQEFVDFSLSCYANKVIFVLEEEMSTYDGQFLTISVDDIPSIEGNISLPHSWTFRVITQKLYWADADTVRLRMYQDDVATLLANLENSTLNETISGVSFAANDGAFDSWIMVTDPVEQPFSVNPSGRTISFEIDASLDVGIYNETIDVLGVEGFGNTPQLHVQLEILVKPPNWEVDPADFSQSMNMIANWKYDEETALISTDLADLISVWVDGEIRGVASISESGEFYASYLTIYGSPEDNSDSHLEFRIWDADLGLEYDGHPVDSIFFAANTSRGTTSNPEILFVDSEYDRARYIFLRDGWTGFSLNTTTDNMEVEHKLRTLKSLTDGDLIVTGDKFSQYSDSLGWFNFGAVNLEEIDNNEGYMIYLDNGPDTLRVTGNVAPSPDITLNSGWNWIGFPFENFELINDVLNLNTVNATGDDQIKLDFPLPGDAPLFANYHLGNDNWDDGNLDTMQANNLYKLYSGHPNGAILTWTPDNNYKDIEVEEVLLKMMAVDPNDASTWVMPDFDSENVMPVIAEVIKDGIVASDTNDMVAFFESDTIRALANITYLSDLNVYALSLLAEESGSNYDIRYYDASEDTVFQSTNILAFGIDPVGSILNPYEIQFEENPCPQNLVIGPTGNPFVQDKTFEASQEITIMGTLNIPANVNIILSAPKVSILDILNTGEGATVTVRPDGCN